MVPMSSPMTVVLALKHLHLAKSRLAGATSSDAEREELVAAMLADTVGAVRRAGAPRIVVVSPDPRVRRSAGRLEIDTCDEPAAPGLNAALAHGARRARPGDAVVYLQADLPALTPESFGAAVDSAARHTVAFVSDRAGEGTTLLAVASGAVFTPAFGPGSAAAHRRAGAVELDPARTRWPDLRCDVDTAADLRAATLLGLGPHTAPAVLDPRARDVARNRR